MKWKLHIYSLTRNWDLVNSTFPTRMHTLHIGALYLFGWGVGTTHLTENARMLCSLRQKFSQPFSALLSLCHAISIISHWTKLNQIQIEFAHHFSFLLLMEYRKQQSRQCASKSRHLRVCRNRSKTFFTIFLAKWEKKVELWSENEKKIALSMVKIQVDAAKAFGKLKLIWRINLFSRRRCLSDL